MNAKHTRKVGDVKEWDDQSDSFRGEYRLLHNNGGNRWTCERLAPSAAIIDAIVAYGAEAERNGWSYLGTIEEVMAEVARREEEAGELFELRFVSRDQWDAMF